MITYKKAELFWPESGELGRWDVFKDNAIERVGQVIQFDNGVWAAELDYSGIGGFTTKSRAAQAMVIDGLWQKLWSEEVKPT